MLDHVAAILAAFCIAFRYISLVILSWELGLIVNLLRGNP